MLLGLISVSCRHTKTDNPSVTTKLVVENVISSDKQGMYLLHGGNYRWYETLILLDDYLDEENDGSITEVVNVFQSIKDYGKSFDTKVHKFQHFADGTCVSDSVDGFWIEDFPLVDSVKMISFDEAFKLMQEVNLPKPHSRHVCLRNPIGPKECNPQWCFGNIESQIWIDAVTGEAKSSNPAFPDEVKCAFNW